MGKSLAGSPGSSVVAISMPTSSPTHFGVIFFPSTILGKSLTLSGCHDGYSIFKLQVRRKYYSAPFLLLLVLLLVSPKAPYPSPPPADSTLQPLLALDTCNALGFEFPFLLTPTDPLGPSFAIIFSRKTPLALSLPPLCLGLMSLCYAPIAPTHPPS